MGLLLFLAVAAGGYYWYQHRGAPAAPANPPALPPGKDLLPAPNDAKLVADEEALYRVRRDAVFGDAVIRAELEAQGDVPDTAQAEGNATWVAGVPSQLVQTALEIRAVANKSMWSSDAPKTLLLNLAQSFRDKAARITGMGASIDSYMASVESGNATITLSDAVDAAVLPIFAIATFTAGLGAPSSITGPIDVVLRDRTANNASVGVGTVSDATKIKDLPASDSSPAAGYYVGRLSSADAAYGSLVGKSITVFVPVSG